MITIDEAKKLVVGAFGNELRKVAVDCLLTFFWGSRQEDGDYMIDNNGSAFLLDCGQGPFLVTAAHVYQGFLEKKSTSNEIVAQVNNLSFDPESRLIDQNPECDIATFEITPEEISQLGKTPLKGYQSSWPPKPPQEGNGIFFAGCPGQERRLRNHQTCEFGIYTAIGISTTVSDKNISCQFEREYWVEHPNFPLPEESYDLGGISGAPIISLRETESGIIVWCLGGVIYEANKELEILFAARADYIQPDGKLKNWL